MARSFHAVGAPAWLRTLRAAGLARAMLVGLAAVGGCAPAKPATGPAADAAAALARGDQRVLRLISILGEGDHVWLPLGLDCYPMRDAPARWVGSRIEDGDTYRTYVETYNRALATDRRYRFAKVCKPL